MAKQGAKKAAGSKKSPARPTSGKSSGARPKSKTRPAKVVAKKATLKAAKPHTPKLHTATAKLHTATPKLNTATPKLNTATPKLIAKPRRLVNELPPKDHSQVLGPLFLAAGHGHLTRAIDGAWKTALRKYREAFADAMEYERKRSPEARLTFVLIQAQKLRMMIANLTTRMQHLVNDPVRAHAADLVNEIAELNKLLGDLASGLLRGLKFDEPQRQTQLIQTQVQIQNEHASQVARAADLERIARKLD